MKDQIVIEEIVKKEFGRMNHEGLLKNQHLELAITEVTTVFNDDLNRITFSRASFVKRAKQYTDGKNLELEFSFMGTTSLRNKYQGEELNRGLERVYLELLITLSKHSYYEKALAIIENEDTSRSTKDGEPKDDKTKIQLKAGHNKRQISIWWDVISKDFKTKREYAFLLAYLVKDCLVEETIPNMKIAKEFLKEMNGCEVDIAKTDMDLAYDRFHLSKNLEKVQELIREKPLTKVEVSEKE